MKTIDYIKNRQKIWAGLNNVILTGSKNERGEKMYTSFLNNNLFQPLSQETEKEIKNGDGNEFGDNLYPGKIQALHSSSALAVNIFDYWRNIKDKTTLAKSLRINSRNLQQICFEKKYKVINGSNDIPPNIDVVIEYENGDCCAIECKFSEPFNKRSDNYGLKAKYLTKFDFWSDLSNIKKLAEKISPNDTICHKLHCAQLIKHILGLIKHYNGNKNRFTLLYLYYDVFGEDGCRHNNEVNEFYQIVKADNISFKAITYQELIINMYTMVCNTEHEPYIEYLCRRYL